MRTIFAATVLAVAASCGGTADSLQPQVAPDTSFPAEPEVHPVEVDLLTSAQQVAPGQHIEVAVRFAIEPGWKIYWSNPGETGLPTEASVRVPDGFEVSEVEYPGPQSFEGPKGTRSYGYTNEVLLTVRIKAPSEIADREVPLVADVSWLACEDSCKRGRKELDLRLPVVSSPSSMTPAHEQLFAMQERRVPAPLDEHACELSAVRDARSVTIDCAGATVLEFFPARDNQQAFAGQLATSTVAGARVMLRYRSELPETIRGVLRAETAGESRYYRIERGWR